MLFRSQQLLADQPERVASLALINSAGFGSEVTLVEALPRIVPVEDEEISAELTKAFAKRPMAARSIVVSSIRDVLKVAW